MGYQQLHGAGLVVVVFAGGATAISVFFDSLAAYALSRLDFPGKTLAFYIVLATLMIPFQITLIPVFQTVFDLGWLNTYQGLIVPRATSAFGIFLLRQFFVTVPRELDAAARMDGAGFERNGRRQNEAASAVADRQRLSQFKPAQVKRRGCPESR